MRTPARFVLALALLPAAGGCHVSGAAPDRPDPARPSSAASLLAALPVAPPGSMRGYSRERFPHWRRVGRGCDVRDSVLRRDGLRVRSDGCNVTSGRWRSPYDGRTLTRLDDADVDHLVPLANAWRSGPAAWTDGRRSAFANDLDRPQLLTVSATANRAKGDRDPARWRPPRRERWCRYAVDWIAVKSYWRLSVTRPERDALAAMLRTC